MKTATLNQTGVTLIMNIKMFNVNNLPHKLLLTTRQKTKLRNTFENDMSINIKLSKAQISKMVQSGGLSKIIGLLMKAAVSLAKFILAPLGIKAAASAISAGIQKKIHSSGTTTLIFSNEEMNGMTKIVQDLEDSNILLKKVTKIIKNVAREKKRGVLGMLLGTLGVVRNCKNKLWK